MLNVVGAIPSVPSLFGRVAMNSSMLSFVLRSRIAKKNVSAHRTVVMSTGLVKRTTAPANGDTNSFGAGCTPSSGSGPGEKIRKLRGSSRPFSSPAVYSATQIARGAFCTSHGSRSPSAGG